MKLISSRSCLTLATAAVTAGLTAPALAGPPAGQGYKLLWADEFGGTALDQMKWSYNYSWGRTHNHAAYMDPSQVIVGNGALNLQAVKVRNPNAKDFYNNDFGWQTMDYTSGAVNSAGKFTASGGYFEANMKLPSALGSWPAFWMLKSGWPPEIDIMEYPRSSANSASQYWANLHYTNASNAHASYGWQTNIGADLSAAYHTYGLEWSATKMTFFVDGNALHTVTDANAIADAQNMYLILNHAVGGWGGTPTATTPQDFLIDYVRVWQKPTTTAGTLNWAGTAASGSWDTGGNWGGVAPTLQDQTAAFNTNANGAVSVNWNGLRTAGGLSFDGSTAYTVGNANGGLMLTNSTGPAAITMAATATAQQTIASRVEAYSDLYVTNNSASTLALAGVIVGGGSVTYEGPGTTLITNNNTYTGNTYIDAGTQGAAVVRVDRSRPFGTGTVIFNTAGNNTSGRIEVQSTREVPNAVTLSGRTNGTVAIQNLSDNNKFSGTISAVSGGNQYIIQSDAGQLELSGTDPAAAGIALRAGAAGTRVFTLRGNGNGLVSGKVVDGAGVVGLIKSGTGTWSLTGANTFTGGTTIAAGTLRVGPSAAATFLTAAGGANIQSGRVVFDYTPGSSPLATIKALLTNGYGTHFAAGQLRSSTAGPAIGLGYADSGTAVTVVSTLYGDANLDLLVDFNDFLALQNNFGQSDTTFGQGDFNYDGTTDFNDFLALQNNFGQSIGGGVPAPLTRSQVAALTAFATSVPEPTTTAMLGVATLVAAQRRRRGAA